MFGGGGSIGAAVAIQFASDGAEVFLAGRTAESVETAAKQIEAAGGRARADVVDALDAAAVEAYLESVVARAGGVDIEFNATGPRASQYANGKPAADVATDIGGPSPGGAAADAMILRCPHSYPRTIRTGDEKGPLETDGA